MTPAFVEILRLWRLVLVRWSVYLLMIAGLVLAYGSAIVIGLYVRDEMTYDRFVPGAENIYLLSPYYGPRNKPLVASDLTPSGVAGWMKSDLPSVSAVTRLNAVEWPMSTPLRKVRERFYWADANFFDVVPLPVLRGDLRTALRDPGSVVMTRRMARAYFGRDDVIGRTLRGKGDIVYHVTAVLKDFPANTTIDREIFAAGSGDYTMLAILDRYPDLLWPTTYTFARFRSGADVKTLPDAVARITRAHWRGANNIPVKFDLVPLNDLHFRPHGDGQMKSRGHINLVLALIVVAIATLALAGINVSGLILAETSERGAEMAIRRALGARRIDLVSAILKESLCINAVSMALALAITERLLPGLNHLLDLDMSMWTMPVSELTVIAAVTVAVGGLSGLFPALVVSRPYKNTKGAPRGSGAGGESWRGWVVAQVALVIVLLVATHTIIRQWNYATQAASNFNGDNVLMIKYSDDPDANARFVSDVRRVPGVITAAESFGTPTTEYVRPGLAAISGRQVPLTRNSVHPDFFRVYDIPVLAGRNLQTTFVVPEVPAEVLINASAVKALGFASPEAAIGQVLTYDTDRTRMRSRIAGVVPDLRFATVYDPTEPMIFDSFAKYFSQINVRIDPRHRSQTIRDIDALWVRDTRDAVPIDRRFFQDYLVQQYHDLSQQIRVFNLVAAIGIVLSALGLTGLSIFLTRHQLREMAIRRALGATFADIFQQRLAPFFLPLVLANLLAVPIAWLGLGIWLSSFNSHVALSPLSFIGAGLVSVVFSLLTLAAYSFLTIRDVPLRALRHE